MSFCEYTYEKLYGTHRRTSTALLFFLTQQIHRSLPVMVVLLIFAIFVAAKQFLKKLHCHFRRQHLPVVSSCFKISNDFYLNRKRNFEIEITQNAWMKHGTNDFIDVANAKIWRYEWIWAQNFFQCISNVFLVVCCLPPFFSAFAHCCGSVVMSSRLNLPSVNFFLVCMNFSQFEHIYPVFSDGVGFILSS